MNSGTLLLVVQRGVALEPPRLLEDPSIPPGEHDDHWRWKPERMVDMVNSTFRLNPGFVRSVAEWYSDDQANLLLAIEDAAKRNPNETPSPAPRQPSPKGRLIRHIRSMLEEAFWASLRTEEGRRHNFALKYGPQSEDAPSHKDPIVLNEPLSFNSRTLAKLAPALHSTQVIGGWPREAATGKGELVIWGFAQTSGSMSLQTIEPGKIIVSVGFGGKAGMDGQIADFVSEYALQRLRDVFQKARRNDVAQDAGLVEIFRSIDLEIIARAMRSHGKGGTLLVVGNYDKCVVDEMRYSVKPDQTLKAYLESRDSALRDGRLAGDRKVFQKLLESIGQLTAVDGATMVTYDLRLLGFGAKIKPRSSSEQFDLRLSGPFENSHLRRERSSDMSWGTRHKSAAQFIFDQRDALAIVASQDGRLSVFMWDDAEQAVSVTEEAEFLLL